MVANRIASPIKGEYFNLKSLKILYFATKKKNRILIFFKVFKNIDWDSRKKATTDRSGCISKNDFESCFTYKYLWYKMEPEQIDFDNPFEIEEGNQMR